MNIEENLIYDDLSKETLLKILDNAFDEIFVYDNNYKVVFVNRACERHYGMKPSEIIGKTFQELLSEECWYPSILPKVYKEKRRMTIEQKSYLGEIMTTTAVPVFNVDDDIELVVMSVRDNLEEIVVARKKLSNYEDSIDKSVVNRDVEKNSGNHNIIYRSMEMKKIINISKQIAMIDSTVLIRGESGTGKGVLAEFIHSNSTRSDKPIISINCAAIPENLLESELFGYVKGAFTGADDAGRKGLIELANGGTLFLDEIGELPLRLQAKILHVIQNKQFIPLGAREIKNVDIRIITATNRNLIEMVNEKTFREDLFWRLNVIEIEIPALRERKEDITALSNYFLNKFNTKYNQTKEMSVECIEFFYQYGWPGNVRQLENIMERLVIMSEKQVIKVSDLPQIYFRGKFNANESAIPESYEIAVEDYERKIIQEVYSRYKTSVKVAKILKLSQSKASRLIRKYCD